MRIDREGRARKAKPGRKDITRNQTSGANTRVNKPVNSVLSFVAALRPTGPSLHPLDPAFASLVVSILHTPPTRCFPVRASRRRAKRRVTRVSSANNLKLNLTGFSSSSLLYPSYQASHPHSSSGAPSIPTGTASTFTALPVMEGECS